MVITTFIGKASLISKGCRVSTVVHSMNLRGKMSIPIEERSGGNLYTIFVTPFFNGISNESTLKFNELVILIENATIKSLKRLQMGMNY